MTESPEVRFLPGHIVQNTPHRYWLLKFDGIRGNADRGGSDPPGMTRVEYIYSLIARSSGIRIPGTRLLQLEDRDHLLIERFERKLVNGKTDRIHYAS